MSDNPPHQNSSNRSAESYIELAQPDFDFEPETIDESTRTECDCDEPDLSDSLEDHKFSYKLRSFEQKLQNLEQDLKERQDIHDLRKKYSFGLFVLSSVWIAGIFIVILLEGFGQWFTPIFFPESLHYIDFKLNDSVLIAFITSTTATILGLYGIAAYWLFGKKKSKKHDKKKTAKRKKKASTKQ